MARELGLTKNLIHRTAPSENPNESENHHFSHFLFYISETIAKHSSCHTLTKYIFPPKIKYYLPPKMLDWGKSKAHREFSIG